MRWLLAAVFAQAAAAQIDSVSVAANGDVFFTSYLRPSGSDYVPWRKGYRLNEQGVALAAQEDPGLTHAWRIDSLEASRDGRVLLVNRSGAMCGAVSV